MKLEILKSPAGPGSRPLLFLHGMWHNARCWARYFMPFFKAHGYSSYSLSFRGHGGSPGILSESGIDDYAADIEYALEETGPDPVFIAHSMGGYVLQKYMLTHKTTDCVFIASIPPKGIRAAAARAAKLLPELSDSTGPDNSIQNIVDTPERFKLLFLSENTPKKTTHDYFSLAGKESEKAFADMLSPVKPVPGNCPQHVLAIGAENDVLISNAEIRALARAYNGKLAIIPETAHDMMIDANWRLAAGKILDWLENPFTKHKCYG